MTEALGGIVRGSLSTQGAGFNEATLFGNRELFRRINQTEDARQAVGGPVGLRSVYYEYSPERRLRVRVAEPRVGQPRWNVLVPASTTIACGNFFLIWRLLIRSSRDHVDAGMFAIVLLLLAAGAYLIWGMLRDAWTNFDGVGIRRPSVTGMRTFAWSEIRLIRARGGLVDCAFASGRFRLNLYVFRDSREVVEFVRARVPESVIHVVY